MSLEQLTDRVAGLSLGSVVLILAGLTLMRGGANVVAARAAWGRALSDLLEAILIAITLVFLLLRPFVVQSFFIPSSSMRPTLREGDHILVNKGVYRFGAVKHGEVIVFRAPPTADPNEKDFIKRVIGLPGDVIEVREGYIQIGNDSPFLPTDARSLLGLGRSVEAVESADDPPLRLTRDALFLGERRVSKDEFARIAGHPGRAVRIVPGQVLRNNEMLVECRVAEDPQYHLSPTRVPPGHLFVLGDNRNESHDSHKWGMLPARRVIGRADIVFWPLRHAKRIND